MAHNYFSVKSFTVIFTHSWVRVFVNAASVSLDINRPVKKCIRLTERIYIPTSLNVGSKSPSDNIILRINMSICHKNCAHWKYRIVTVTVPVFPS